MCVYVNDFKIPKPTKLSEDLRQILKCDFHKYDCEIDDVTQCCAARICSDLVSRRKNHPKPTEYQRQSTPLWQNAQQAVFACTETDDRAQKTACFDALTRFSATLDGERQFYEWHGVEAAAGSLGCARQAGAVGVLAQEEPVVDLELIRLILICFLMATFNANDQKSRAAVIGLEGGILALVGSLLAMQDQPTPEGSTVADEEAVLMLALKLCDRLGQNDSNMRTMRTTNAVKMARRCLASSNRELRVLSEETINKILNLADIG